MTTTEESKLSEAEFLEAQAAEARAAMQETWDDLKSTLKETASLDVWAKRHPWVVAGAAVAGGFLIATLLFSPALDTEPAAAEEPPEPTSSGRRRRLGWLVTPLFGLLRPMFGQLVSSLMAAALGALTGAMAAAPDEDPSSDAHGNGAMPGEGPVPL